MANFEDYRTQDGKKRVLAVVRIKGFKRSSRAFDTLRDAKEWAQRTESELRGLRDRGGARSDITTLTLAALAKAYLADPRVRQLRTINGIEKLIGSWVNEYGTERARAFGYLQIVFFRDSLLSSGLSPARVNRYLSAMRKCWNWGNPHYVQTPWPQKIMLEEPKPEAINDHYGTSQATIDDVHSVIAAADQISPHLGNLTRFLIGTGARVSDALAITWRDIDSKTNAVTIRGQKTQRKQRVAMLSLAIESVSRASLVKNISDARIFWQFRDIHALRSPWRRARKHFPEKMTRLRLHDCRHLCASFLAAAGASHVELAAQLGHQTLAMVKRYSHLAGGHRSEAHDKLDAALNLPRP